MLSKTEIFWGVYVLRCAIPWCIVLCQSTLCYVLVYQVLGYYDISFCIVSRYHGAACVMLWSTGIFWAVPWCSVSRCIMACVMLCSTGIFWAVLCCAISCCVVLFHVVSRHFMLCCVTACVMLSSTGLHGAVLCCAISCCAISCMLCCVVPYHVVLCHGMCHVVSHRVVSYARHVDWLVLSTPSAVG